MSSEAFFSRWSKRKRAAQTADPPEGPAAEPVSVSSEAAPEAAVAREHSQDAAPAVELTEEEIAALPSIEELTVETDISVFLRKGVPEPLRNAALRQMWSLDPTIRDFVGDAREYAYDWNTPGGVPGYGPLPSTEDVARMVARIVGGDAGDALAPAHAGADERGGAAQRPSNDPDQSPDAGAAGENPALGAAEQPLRATAHVADTVGPALSVERHEPGATAETIDGDEGSNIASPRRHGSAMPL